MTPNEEAIARRAQAQQYVEELELMFMSPGWKQLLETFQDFDDVLTKSALSVSSVEDFWVAKGRHDAFLQLLNFQDFIDGYRVSLEAEPLAAEAEDGP